MFSGRLVTSPDSFDVCFSLFARGFTARGFHLAKQGGERPWNDEEKGESRRVGATRCSRGWNRLERDPNLAVTVTLYTAERSVSARRDVPEVETESNDPFYAVSVTPSTIEKRRR